MTDDDCGAARSRHALQHFAATPLNDLLAGASEAAGAEAALALFHEAARTVPAYARFLAAHGVDPATIAGSADLSRVPLTTRANYITAYDLADRCRGGRLESCDLIATSSGSTGMPTFWPRAPADEIASAERFAQVFEDAFAADRRRTLVVVCFALGTWVGGMYTTACCRHLAARGLPLTVVTPGNNRDEILRCVEGLAPQFEQTVLAGYPPFVKDVIDAGRARGLDWQRWNLRLVFAGEVFSEEWRALVHARAGIAQHHSGSASLYGTADAGVLGIETPLCIIVRTWLAAHPAVARALFGAARLPTLVQYDPRRRWFECHDGRLVFTGDNGVPLLRYLIADEGGLLGFDALLAALRAEGCDALAAARAAGVRVWREQPFAWVFGRSHFVLSWYGANIYPENLMIGLERAEICDFVTGRFVMLLPEDDAADPRLEVHVELAAGVAAAALDRAQVEHCLLEELRRLNSEYAHYVPAERQRPRVQFHAQGDPEWFPTGVKHRYTRVRG